MSKIVDELLVLAERCFNASNPLPIDRLRLALEAALAEARERTPLTDAEIRRIQAAHPTENDPLPFARAVLKAQEEKT